MNFGADNNTSGFSISKIWQHKGDIIEIIVAVSAVFFLDLILDITSGAEYIFAHRLILATAVISLVASIIFVRLNPESAIVRLVGLFDKDDINSILKNSSVREGIRRFYNYPYYTAHIFLVLYSIEYLTLPYYSHLADFNPVDKMYFIISVIIGAFFVSFLASIMDKMNIPKATEKFILIFPWVFVLWLLDNFSDKILPAISFIVGIPPIVSAYVLLRSINVNRSVQ